MSGGQLFSPYFSFLFFVSVFLMEQLLKSEAMIAKVVCSAQKQGEDPFLHPVSHFRVPLNTFLSSANKVSTGPTCQLLCVCLSVCVFMCLFVFPVFFSRRLIGRYTGFWQWFWHPTYPTKCLELAWAVRHSDFLAWLSSATLRFFSSAVSSRILMR